MSIGTARLRSSSAIGPVCTDLYLAESESDFYSDTRSNPDADIDSDNYCEDSDADDNGFVRDGSYDPKRSWAFWGTDSVLL